jgi:hypothetical protein
VIFTFINIGVELYMCVVLLLLGKQGLVI